MKSKYKITEEGRECSRCKIFKPWSAFAKNIRGTRGHQSWCRTCRQEQSGHKKRIEYHITKSGRECSKCRQFKPWSEFYKRPSVSTGHNSRCKKCFRKITRLNMENGIIRNRELKRKYSIDLEAYQKMVANQGDRCGICGTMDKGVARGKVRYWSVDHDHKTGAIRKLLCQKCNALLGLAQDDVAVLERAIAYLREHAEPVCCS